MQDKGKFTQAYKENPTKNGAILKKIKNKKGSSNQEEWDLVSNYKNTEAQKET